MKIVGFGDLVVQTGFGRIGNEVAKRLVQRGHQFTGVGMFYGGQPHGYPFWIYPTAGQDIWSLASGVINGTDADIVLAWQDFPYHVSLWRDCPIDWSAKKFVFITPIDGIPVYNEWSTIGKQVDGVMAISLFGIDALRQEGVRATHCPPGIDTNEFHAPTSEEKKEFRLKANIPEDAFVMGMFCMNQGRKNIPGTIQVFAEFAKDKPNAYLYLDMDANGPGGWDIRQQLINRVGAPGERVIIRDQVAGALPSLRDRYCLLDVHSLVSFREGFGLPAIEAMACGAASITFDWCAGTEIAQGRMDDTDTPEEVGLLVKRQDYMTYGTWGGARDAFPDHTDWLKKLNTLYYEPEYRLSLAAKGMRYAQRRTWDRTTDAVEKVLKEALNRNVISISERDHTSVQQPSGISAGASLGDTNPPGGTNTVGDNPSGRLQPVIQFDNDIFSAIQSSAQPEESGVRRELQPGSKSRKRRSASVH